MADSFQAISLEVAIKELWKIVLKGLKHERTAQNLRSEVNESLEMFAEIEELARNTKFPDQEIENLKRIVREMQEAHLKCSKIEWWNFFLAPYYQQNLEKAEKAFKDFISFQWKVQTAMNFRPDDADRLKVHMADPSSVTSVELNSPLENELKSYLMKDGGDPVLNLYGFAGSGKTTFAKKLSHDDTLVRGWFDSILFVSLGSEIESNGNAAKHWKDELRLLCKKGKAVLLVLDNVESGSEELVEQCRNQISSNSKSKILVISRVELPGLGIPVPMTPLAEDDAITLLRHYVQPIGTSTSSYNFPDHRTLLRKVVSSCGRYPIAIKLIGTQLRGQPIEYWQKMLKRWPRQGDSSHDTSTELLSRLQDSLNVSENFDSLREFFMDLGLFPENQMIPVTALIDMWVEFYQQDEDGIDAMIHIHKLTDINLAEMVVTRRVGRNDDNYHNDLFLKQHELLRELAIHMSQEPPIENRRRLIIDMNGNHRPQWWPQNNQLKAAAPILSMSTDQNITPYWCNIQESGAVVLVLNLVTTEYTLPEFIKKMENLKVLMVTNYGSLPAKLSNFEVLNSLQSLKRIRLQDVSIPSLCNLENVHKLSFSSCEVKKAFEDSSIEFSKAMPNLAVLNIEGCEDLVEFPVGFCDIITLKKLNITSCGHFTEIPKEIGKLEKLELLWITYCPEFRNMPVSITNLKNLSSLNISYCGSLRKLPDNIGELTSLVKLYVEGCPELRLPASVIDMEHLEIYPPQEGIQALSVLD